jgi:hypothetical protein
MVIAPTLWSLIRCFAFVMSRCWRLSALALVLPVVVCLAGLNFWSFVRGCNYLGDALHFVVARPYYEHITPASATHRRNSRYSNLEQ